MHKGTRRTQGRILGFLEEGDPRNEALALGGAEQTAQKAKVAAVVRATMRAKKPIDIISDSRYTVDGAPHKMAGQRPGSD